MLRIRRQEVVHFDKAAPPLWDWNTATNKTELCSWHYNLLMDLDHVSPHLYCLLYYVQCCPTDYSYKTALLCQFVGNFSCEFITINHLHFVKQHCKLRENEQLQQANLFKCQTVTFIFQHIFHIHLNIYPNWAQSLKTSTEWLPPWKMAWMFLIL